MSPNSAVYWRQLVTIVGALTGPCGAIPMNPAMAVPTPSMGAEPDGTSST